jgi:hypothetical protein
MLLAACGSAGQPTASATFSRSPSTPVATPTMLTATASAYLAHLTDLNAVVDGTLAAITADPGVLADKRLAYAKPAAAYKAFALFVRTTPWPADVQSAAREACPPRLRPGCVTCSGFPP